MASTSGRIVVQVTTGQKRAIARTARRLGLNPGELMRQAAQGFAPSEDERDLLDLINRANASAKQASESLVDTLSFIQESNKRIAAMNAGNA